MMEGEEQKLPTLLSYFIQHNGEHSDELMELAEKTKTIANDVVRDHIREAARLMNESTEYLKRALVELDK